ncbi:hypothetical protein [Hyphomonas johnsonii]|nr:hypothetical protein [Hyphomonas johnsonii]
MTRTIYEAPGLADILLKGNGGLDQLEDGDRLHDVRAAGPASPPASTET